MVFDATIEDLLKAFSIKLGDAIYAAKQQMGVKHFRVKNPVKNRIRLRKVQGMNVLSIMASKGDIMTHKGKGGKGQDNRVEKPFINEPGDELLPELADELAMRTGDVICYKLVQ